MPAAGQGAEQEDPGLPISQSGSDDEPEDAAISTRVHESSLGPVVPAARATASTQGLPHQALQVMAHGNDVLVQKYQVPFACMAPPGSWCRQGMFQQNKHASVKRV